MWNVQFLSQLSLITSTCQLYVFLISQDCNIAVITGRNENEVLAKVIFLHQVPPPPGTRQVHPPGTRQVHPPGPGRYTPPGPGRYTPLPDQVHPPRPGRYTPPGPGRYTPRTRYTPPGPGRYTPPQSSRLQNTVNDRPVRILLECILISVWLFVNLV